MENVYMKKIALILAMMALFATHWSWGQTMPSETGNVPQPFKVSREGIEPEADPGPVYALDLMKPGTDKPVFNGCRDNAAYVAFQLFYDVLAHGNTTVGWTLDVDLALLHAEDTVWNRPLHLEMAGQTFIATLFHDEALTCLDDYHFAIVSKDSTGTLPSEFIDLKVLYFDKISGEFIPSTVFPFSCAYNPAAHETALSWSFPSGQPLREFDVEWVFIDSADLFTGDAEAAFVQREPVRVSTSASTFNYDHQVYYPSGMIWYRIRAVGYNLEDPTHRVLGNWQYMTTGIVITNHEKNMTWQEQIVYAEEGKSKRVVSYFDENLRQRQALTNLSSQQTTLVSEALYDFEGRKVVDILPVPARDNLLTYHAQFHDFQSIDNGVGENTGALQQKFNYDNNRLENSILKDAIGAGNYYSPASNYASVHKGMIPDGEGYVYSQVEYTRDGTGRVSRQSGVGKEFRHDGDHTTRYFYAGATQAELRRLFGSNVGNAAHYKKNMVVDPNGQVSVSYLDQESRVIATALGGDVPSNVDSLESFRNLDLSTITEVLTEKNRIEEGKSITRHGFLNVAPNTVYTFRYDLSAMAAEVESGGCLSCAFDLHITLTDAEGSLVQLPANIPGNQSTDGLHYRRDNITTADCNNPTTLNDIEFQVTLTSIGDYTITKTLVPHEMSFAEIRTELEQDSSTQVLMQRIRDSYVADPTDCEICTETCDEAEAYVEEAIDEIAALDCENILRQIEQYVEQNPGSSPTEHPLYCKYQLCVKNRDSDAFDKRMARVATWSLAVASGKSNPIAQDPFFNNASLSGYTYKSAMQDVLNNTSVGTIGTITYSGTIFEVTDPANAEFYVDSNGDHDVNGKHILYLDLMSRRTELGETAYQAELDKQRWIMYRSMYEEAKRQIKLSIAAYSGCASAMEDLQPFRELVSYDDQDIKDWAVANGLKESVSAAELEMSLYSITNACSATLTTPDSTSVVNHLRAYFDGNPQNLLRIVHIEDITRDNDLKAINNILIRYNCSLDSVALTNMMACVLDTVVTISGNTVSPNFLNDRRIVDGNSANIDKGQSSKLIYKTEGTIGNLQKIALESLDERIDTIANSISRRIETRIKADILASSRHASRRGTIELGSKESLIGPTTNAIPDRVEYDALLALYNATNDFTDTVGSVWERTDWFQRGGWADADPQVVEDVSTWYGITTDAYGHVIALDLRNNRLNGSLPDEIGNLSYLQYLDLGNNELHDTIPEDLYGLTNLQHLDLSANFFSGFISDNIGDLLGLRHLSMGYNELQGTLPNEIGFLAELLHLDLGGNHLQGVIPEEVFDLSNLSFLNLGVNSLVGTISPGIGDLSNLEYLNLSINQLQGTLPAGICNLTNLVELNLSSNQLDGSIPSQIGSLSKLKYLSLFSNNLNGGLPEGLYDLKSTRVMDLGNNRIEGGISEMIGELTNLEFLNLYSNQLQGNIPKEIGELSNLLFLDLGLNHLNGNIPAEVGNLSNLQLLNFTFNQLQGSIPSTLGNLSHVESMSLSANHLIGNIPVELGFLSNLWHLDLSNNKIEGDVGPLSNLHALEYLNLGSNKIDSIPRSIGNLSNLITLYLMGNRLKGSIPPEVGNLSNLEILALHENSLTGEIPSALGNLARLTWLAIDRNQLTGSIPASFGNTSLQSLHLFSNKLTGEIPSELANLNLRTLALSDNELSGNFPLGIAKPQTTRVWCEGNNFTFANLIDAFSGFYNESGGSVVAPQDSVDVRKSFLSTSSPVTFVATVDRNVIPKLQYQWFKFVDGINDVALTARDTSSHTFTIASPTSSDAGQYYYRITNDGQIPGSSNLNELTLSSRLQTLIVGPRTFVLCLQYDSTNSTVQKFTIQIGLNDLVEQCTARAAQEDAILTEYAIDRLLEDKASSFYSEFKTKCLGNVEENLEYMYIPKEYHYTLYYYDQSANLVQTVPPAGVHPSIHSEPAHELVTRYRYNSLNQLIWQSTPDAGESNFWYNDKGQLKASRNAQQDIDSAYSYTRYDALGRIVEVGEMKTLIGESALRDSIQSISYPHQSDAILLTDITRTHYDSPAKASAKAGPQTNLRTRVSYVEVIDGWQDTTRTFYSYDIHGNVKSLVQSLPKFPSKRTDYVYDLVSGKVNYVMFQYGEADEFIHRYDYDEDNRITEVSTSSDGFKWMHDAEYLYYAHGPLARVELGEYKVQGLDYYYTLQGWIKGVNMPYEGDPGGDGISSAEDVFAYSLGYYHKDYKPINNSVTLSDSRDKLWTRQNEMNNHQGMYNGNISWMVTDLAKIGGVNNDRTKGMQAMVYKYDQVHRITKSRSLAEYTTANGFARNTTAPAYDEDYTYDANGNLLTLDRKDHQGNTLHDFDYQYYPNTNKLRQVGAPEDVAYDGALSSNTKLYRKITLKNNAYVPQGRPVELRAFEEIEMDPNFQAASGTDFYAHIVADSGMYQYDKIGNLVLDMHEGVKINWTPYGKVREVRSKSDSFITTFRYDGAGNRIEKKVTRKDSVDVTHITHYVRDAGGNVMGVYNDSLMTEQYVYGTGRLGLYKGGNNIGQQSLGEKDYELSNHLGNVLAVITDNIGINTQDSVWASVVSTSDYYPFGLEMTGRTWHDTTLRKFRYSFNGKEKDGDGEWGDVAYDYGFRIYDPSTGRFMSIDPLRSKNEYLSPYAAFDNSPIAMNDPDGKDAIVVINGNTISITTKIYIYGKDATSKAAGDFQRQLMRDWDIGLQYTDENGKVYSVKFDIQVRVYEGIERNKPFVIPESWNPFNADNFIEVDNDKMNAYYKEKGGLAYVRGGDEGLWSTDQVIGSVIPHELGHLLGLMDRYKTNSDGTGTPLPGWEGNVMAPASPKVDSNGAITGYSTGSVEQKNIDGLLKSIVKKHLKAVKNDPSIENKGNTYKIDNRSGNL